VFLGTRHLSVATGSSAAVRTSLRIGIWERFATIVRKIPPIRHENRYNPHLLPDAGRCLRSARRYEFPSCMSGVDSLARSHFHKLAGAYT